MNNQAQSTQSVTGRVVSAKANKTITVLLERVVQHPLYGKYIRRTSKILVHDENNESKQGDVVLVSACRPISGRKTWILKEIVRIA
jgi:small subunit ribosomal protein S17